MTSTTQQINPKSKLGKVTKAAISLTNNTWSLGLALKEREGLQADLEVAQQNGDTLDLLHKSENHQFIDCFLIYASRLFSSIMTA